MRARVWVEQRIDDMAKCPEMWAVTCEGYLMQLLVLLEFIGTEPDDIRTIGARLFQNNGNKENKPLTIDFATSAITETWKCLAKLNKA